MGIPYFQSVYDLMCLETETSANEAKQIAEWETRSGRKLPAALVELYTTYGTMRLGSRPPWRAPLVDFWYALSNSESPTPLSTMLADIETARAGDHPSWESGKTPSG